MHLTREQFRIAEALGCSFQPAAPEQISRLSMQRRVFWLGEQAFLVQRRDGFYETAATLTRLLQDAKVELPPEEPAPPAPAEVAALPAAEPVAAPLPPPAKPLPRSRQPTAPEPEAEPEPAEAEAALATFAEPLEDAAEDEPEDLAADPDADDRDAEDLDPHDLDVEEPEEEPVEPAAPLLPASHLQAPLLPVLPLSARAETARLVAAFVASTPVAPAELPELIRSIHQSVLSLSRR